MIGDYYENHKIYDTVKEMNGELSDNCELDENEGWLVVNDEYKKFRIGE